MPANLDLPERLELPLASGAPHWYWLGGRPALDLVNTLRERWRRRVETLVTPADLGEWLTRAELLERAPRAIAPELLDEARTLREAIDACACAAVEGRRLPGAAVRAIDGALVHLATRPRLVRDRDGAARLADAVVGAERGGAQPLRAALGAIALDAARMLGTPAEAARIRICASDTCSARFFDRSPAAGRRWCSMTACGNEAKARRLRARRREAAA